MNKVLVVGGAGYIGSHVVKMLIQKGYQAITFDNLSFGHREFVKGEFFEGDLGNIEDIRVCFEKYDISAVMHFSAFASVGESVVDPEKYYINNVENTLNLLRVMREKKVNNFIFSSTAATFGNPLKDRIDEDHPQNPVNPYGRTKLMVEQIVKDFNYAYGLQYMFFRYFNAAGADPELEIGEDHDPETHLIPLALNTLKNKDKQLTVFGDDYATEDGTCIRDYIHVMDLAEAHILGLEYLLTFKKSQNFNLGNNIGYSVKNVIETIEKVTGEKVNYTVGSRRVGDPAVLVASNKKVKEILKWNPKYENLEDIILTAWKWHQKRFPTMN